MRLPSFVGLEGAVRLAPGEDAPLQGTSNVFAIDGQRSVVAAAMFGSPLAWKAMLDTASGYHEVRSQGVFENMTSRYSDEESRYENWKERLR